MVQKITQEKIKWIRELREYVDTICKITKSSKKTVRKICNLFGEIKIYPPIKIPDNMKNR